MRSFINPLAARVGGGGRTEARRERSSVLPRRALRGLLVLLALSVIAYGPASAQCVDGDGDGYGSPGSGDCPQGPQADCDDADAAIFPGATELCNERDDDCDGTIDEEFFVGEACGFGDPDPLVGPCFTAGTRQCLADGSGTFCDVAGAPIERFADETESAGNCNDLADNDCDGLADRADPECTLPAELYCDGADDDQNGLIDDGVFAVGQPCSVGVGGCARSGLLVCSPDPTAAAVCSAVPGRPVTEGPVGDASCFDGLDNDCDGLSDLGDAGCRAVELCDGLDNDGDGLIDESFPSLGAACTSGEGVCRAGGVEVCTGNGLGTECSAVPGVAGFEGPSGITCRDGLDNDCDGAADLEDSGCALAHLSVECALPYVRGGSGGDCTGWHRVEYSVSGALDAVEVRAELLALDEEGALLGRLPVELGDLAQLASRQRVQVMSKSNRHKVFAPVTMLRIEAGSGQTVRQAFCSPLPYLDVIEPAGGVASASANAALEVVAAVPLVEPESLEILVDGEDLVAGIGLDPATAFPGGPYSGSMLVAGRTVEVSELFVDVASDLASPSSNRLTLSLRNLGGGGHAVRVTGEPLPTTSRSAQCHRDDIDDVGIGNVFEVTLLEPQAFASIAQVPTPVRGEVVHGREILAASVNGKALDVDGQVFVGGDGETLGDTYTLSVDTLLDPTDLALELATGDAAAGTLDAGWNRVVLAAQDDLGNQAFAGAHAVVVAATQAAQSLGGGLDGDGLGNGLIVGLTTPAGQTVFTALCETQGQDLLDDVTDEIDQAIGEVPETRLELSGTAQAVLDLVCNDKNRIDFDLEGVDFEPGFELAPSCDFSLADGAIQMSADLPDATPRFAADALCKNVLKNACIGVVIDGTCIGGRADICLLRADVEVEGGLPLTDLGISWELTEAQLESGGDVAIDLLFPDGSLHADITHSDVELGCIVGFLFDVALFVEQVVIIFDQAFGGDGDGFIPSLESVLEDQLEGIDVSDFFDVPDESPMLPLPEIGVSTDLAAFDVGFVSTIDQVEIEGDPDGQLQASFDAAFFPTRIDPEAMVLPPQPVTAPAPAAYPEDAGSVYLALSDDLFNSLFSAMTLSGSLQTGCESAGTVGDFLPADCATLEVPPLSGYCHGLKGADCGALDAGDPVSTASQRGSCRAARGESCNAIADPFERLACQQAPDLDLSADTSLLACSRLDVPPRMLLHDDDASAEIETSVRLNDLSVALVADRDEDGLRDSETDNTPGCGGEGDSGADCLFSELCLDLNVETDLETFSGAAGDPILQATLTDIRQRNQELFVVCGGPYAAFQTAASNAEIRSQIQTFLDAVVQNTPPMRLDGLSLGAAVRLDMPRLIVIETDGDPEFQDYLAITGDLVPAP